MKNYLILFFAAILFSVSSCGSVEVEPNAAEVIEGEYTMTFYETHSGESNPNENDMIIVRRLDDSHVSVTIDYAITTTNDVELNDMIITETADAYELQQTFGNAEATGVVVDSVLTLNVDYASGNFANITAVKN